MKISVYSIIASLLLMCSTTLADLNGLIETVTVGNVGNVADPDPNPRTGRSYGSVNYQYDIGKYEVTNTQYAAFLNSVAASDPHSLYDNRMDTHAQGGIERLGSSGSYTYTVKSGFESKPVVFVSFTDAVRFANWLTNGQGTASTESGSYDLTQPIASVTRSAPAPGMQFQVFIASEDEWYKAAYYDPALNDGAGGYWAYPTQSNIEPTNGVPTGSGNMANYANDPGYLTDVGAYGISSYYGTFDQEGNQGEFTDTITGSSRIRRGSSYNNDRTGSGFRSSDAVDQRAHSIGFRITVVPIPEPSTYAGIFGGSVLVAVILLRRHSIKK